MQYTVWLTFLTLFSPDILLKIAGSQQNTRWKYNTQPWTLHEISKYF